MQVERRIPGEPGIWVLIFGELFIFGIFFATIAATHHSDRPKFLLGQASLNLGLGLANTLLLLTSSLFVALAVDRVRVGRDGAPRLFQLGMACGVAFVAIKAIEYGEKVKAGIGFTTSDFFTLYFAFTAIHLAHVLLGLVVLGLLGAIAGAPVTERRVSVIECGAIFWHLVDLLWIVLFALFYLAR